MIQRHDDQYIGGQFTWFTGIVEDINDAENLNRVRVRCLGWYDASVATSDLPWATVMMPVTSASLKGVGGNHHLEVGSWVVGFFRDGPSAQDPMVMGSVATKTDGERDIPSAASPDNKIYTSKAGHKIEIDNTDGAEEVRITHGKKASYIKIDKDGLIEIKSTVKTRII
jgi:hypothetical protein|tara:strand:- start:3358 stop:3864 length:507 start_codon:yes stop_codon:yes gene_type:complete